jgi:hypothetical protein
MQVLRKPRRLTWQMDEAVLDRCGLREQGESSESGGVFRTCVSREPYPGCRADGRMIIKRPMVTFLTHLLLAIRSRFTRRARLETENLLLRQRLVVLSRKSPTRVRLRNIDRLLFVWLYRLYPSLLDSIIIVQPETVIRWHRSRLRRVHRGRTATSSAPSDRFGANLSITCVQRSAVASRSEELRFLLQPGPDASLIG